MDIASLLFGIFIGLFILTLKVVVEQTSTIWKRTRSLRNAYLYMIWVEAIVNLIFSLMTFLFLHGVIKPG